MATKRKETRFKLPPLAERLDLGSPPPPETAQAMRAVIEHGQPARPPEMTTQPTVKTGLNMDATLHYRLSVAALKQRISLKALIHREMGAYVDRLDAAERSQTTS